MTRVESVQSSNFERPGAAVCLQTRRRRQGRRLLAPQDVIGKLAELRCANVESEWRRRKHKMEKASRSWTGVENRTMQLREYALREFWEIFVDDRPFGADARFSGT